MRYESGQPHRDTAPWPGQKQAAMSPTDRRIAELRATGATPEEIADHLGYSTATVHKSLARHRPEPEPAELSEFHKQVIRMRNNGWAKYEIADELGVSLHKVAAAVHHHHRLQTPEPWALVMWPEKNLNWTATVRYFATRAEAQTAAPTDGTPFTIVDITAVPKHPLIPIHEALAGTGMHKNKPRAGNPGWPERDQRILQLEALGWTHEAIGREVQMSRFGVSQALQRIHNNPRKVDEP